MQYAFNITGTGAEVTQGRVTKDFIQEIYSKLIDEETLEGYFMNLDEEDEICWYDIDDNFHSTGAFIDGCTVSVYTIGTPETPGTLLYEVPASELRVAMNNVTEEVLPSENSIHGSINVLTCQDIYEGFIFTGILSVNDFNPKLLSCVTDTLGDITLIKAVYYNCKPIDVNIMSGTRHKKFIADLAE